MTGLGRFAAAGYVAGSLMLLALGFASFVTVTFVIEAMSLANAVGRREAAGARHVNPVRFAAALFLPAPPA